MRLSGLSRFFAKSLLGAGIFSEASWDGAISNMEHAVALDPGRSYHRLELAEIYVDRKRYDDARDQLSRIGSLPDREIMDRSIGNAQRRWRSGSATRTNGSGCNLPRRGSASTIVTP